MGYALAAPAVAAERSRIFSAVGHAEHAQRQIPYRTQRLGNDGGRAKQHSVCKLQLLLHFRRVGRHHIVAAHVNITAVGNSLRNLLRQHSRIPVGAYVGDDNSLLPVRIHHCGPFPVKGHHLLNFVPHQHRAVARAHHADIQRLHPVQGLQHKRFIRSDNTVKIVAQRL